MEVARAFGFNLPEMAKERDDLVMKLQEAKSETQKAQFQLQLDSLERHFEELMEKISGHDNPVQAAIAKATENMLLDKMNGNSSSLESRWMQRMMDKMERELEERENPPTVSSQLSGALTTLKEFQAIAEALNPQPKSSGMSPEDLLTLETHKLDVEKEIALYRIDKEMEVSKAKAESWTQIGRYVGNGLELIGKSLASDLLESEGAASPGAFDDDDAGDEGESSGDWVNCPDCQQPSLLITMGMRQRARGGEVVEVTCTNCGADHKLAQKGADTGSQEPEAAAAAAASTPHYAAPGAEADPSGRRRRFTTAGKELPRFVAGGN